jgi:membrane protein
MADEPDPREPDPLELDVAPTIPGRIARWTAKARILRSQVEAARGRHRSVDLAFDLVERDSTIGGGMLGGALAYRLFVFLLPLSLFFVAGLGIYADTTEQSPSEVASSSGLTGLIATEVAAAASSPARWAIFIVTLPVLVYAAGMLYRAVAIVHAIAWHGSGRAVRLSSKGFGVFSGVIVAQFACTVIAGRIRRSDQVGGVTALLVYALVLGGAWFALARLLPRRDVGWKALVPGAALVAVGMLVVNAFNVYVTSHLVEERADTYGALGIATALLFSLYIVGRLIVGSAVLNATLDARRRPRPPS